MSCSGPLAGSTEIEPIASKNDERCPPGGIETWDAGEALVPELGELLATGRTPVVRGSESRNSASALFNDRAVGQGLNWRRWAVQAMPEVTRVARQVAPRLATRRAEQVVLRVILRFVVTPREP